MKSPFECRKYAEECRALANGCSEERRREVLRMVDIWEGLARDRERQPPNRKFPAYKLSRSLSFELEPDPDMLLTDGLRTMFDEVAYEPLPIRFLFMLEQLDASEWRASRPPG
jgi:hypothetical protein